MEFVPAVAMAALVLKVIDFLRYVGARDLNGSGTQLITWIAGVAVAFLVAHTEWADGIELGGAPLGKLGFWSLVFVGLTYSSLASAGKDLLKSIDNNNSAKIPTLFAARRATVDRTDTVG